MNLLSEYTYNYFNYCPNCNRSEFRRLGKGTRPSNHLHWQVVSCKNCNLIFVNPIADERSLKLFYKDYGARHPRTLEIPDKIMDKAQKVEKPEGIARFLDVGAASGELMEAFRRFGWEVFGIELSKSFADFAVSERGLKNFYNGEILQAPFENNSFHYINFWHTIEHLRDPVAVLKKIYEWLVPGGMLNLGCPAVDSHYTKLSYLLKNTYDLGEDHTFGFPRSTMHNILTSIGFSVKEHILYSKPKPSGGLVSKIYNFANETFPLMACTFQRVLCVKK